MEPREQEVTPPVARNQSGRCSAVDGRTTRHAGYAMSLCLRKRMAATAGRGRVVMPQSAFRYNFVSHVEYYS